MSHQAYLALSDILFVIDLALMTEAASVEMDARERELMQARCLDSVADFLEFHRAGRRIYAAVEAEQRMRWN